MDEDPSTSEPDSRNSFLSTVKTLFSAKRNKPLENRADLQNVIQEALDNKVISTEVRTIIDGALAVSDTHARDVMIPRSQMVLIKIDDPVQSILKQVVEAGHSRFPVVGDNTDDVRGILLAKDLLPLALEKSLDEFSINKILRPATQVPESKRLNILLREFRESRNHMAMVIDEYGSVSGVITIEDVLEEIVGEIEDEHDTDEANLIRQTSDNEYIIQALTPIEQFNTYFSAKLPEDEFDTVGGLLMKQFGRVPRRNEEQNMHGFDFKVLHAGNRRLHLLQVITPAIPAHQ